MSRYTKYNSVVTVNKEFGDEYENLPADLYVVSKDPLGNYFLTVTEQFSTPSRLYGETEQRAEHIITTFFRRCNKAQNTGVLLTGTKGSGKSLLAKKVSLEMLSKGIPTIMVTQAHFDANFLEFMAKITDKAVVLFDEFDKTYAKQEAQEALLSLLDGTGTGDKLFILTKNSGYISEFFLNRPSRIFYNFNYDKISYNTMEDYLNENLDNKAHMEYFDKLHDVSIELSFDVIQGLVEELNAYPEMTFKDCIDMMGISFGVGVGKWKVKSLTVNNKSFTVKWPDLHGFNPLKFTACTQQFNLDLKEPTKEGEEEALQTSSYIENDEGWEFLLSGNIGEVNITDGGKIIVESKHEGDTFKVIIEQEKALAGNFSKLF